MCDGLCEGSVPRRCADEEKLPARVREIIVEALDELLETSRLTRPRARGDHRRPGPERELVGRPDLEIADLQKEEHERDESKREKWRYEAKNRSHFAPLSRFGKMRRFNDGEAGLGLQDGGGDARTLCVEARFEIALHLEIREHHDSLPFDRAEGRHPLGRLIGMLSQPFGTTLL